MRRSIGIAICVGVVAAWIGTVAASGEQPGEVEKAPRRDKFVYEKKNRRDPFVFTREETFVEKPSPGTGKAPVGPGIVAPSAPEVEKGLTKEELAAITFKAQAAIREAEVLIATGGYVNAIKACDEGLRALEKGKDEGVVSEIRDHLLRMRKAADRLRLRREAEIDFKGKDLQVVGIVAREKKPQVLINNHILTKGSTIPGSDIQIEEIRSGVIICRYKGFKVKLHQVKLHP